MNQFWSRRIRDIVPYTPGEQPRDRNFIKLNTNECPCLLYTSDAADD